MHRYITTTKSQSNDSDKYSIILLASLPQERMVYGPPISLYPIQGYDSVLQMQCRVIRNVFPNGHIYIIVGHNANQIITKCPKDVHILENQKYNEFGEIEELKLGINAAITSSVITISGNIVFDEKILGQAKTPHSSIIIDSTSNDDGAVGIINNQSRLENMAFGLPTKWCYISHFVGKELDGIRGFVNIRNKSNLCMFEAINAITSKRGIIYTVERNDGLLQRIHK